MLLFIVLLFQSLTGRLQTRPRYNPFREFKCFNPSQVGYKRLIEPEKVYPILRFNPSQVGYKLTEDIETVA